MKLSDRLQIDVANVFDQFVAYDHDPELVLNEIARRLEVPRREVARAVHRWAIDWDDVQVGRG